MYYTSQERRQRLVFELVGVEGKEVSKLGEITSSLLDARAAGSHRARPRDRPRRRDGGRDLRLRVGVENSARFSGRSEVVDPADGRVPRRVRTANVVGGGG
jgi:hypothetical protein